MGKKDNKKKKGGQNRSDDDEAMLNASHQASRATEHRSSGHDDHESDDDESADGSLPLCFDPGYPKRLLEKMDPSVRDRIYALRALQDKYVTEAYDQYVEEMCTLEKRYEAIFAPLYARRAALIKGEALPTSEEVEKGTPDDETTAKRLQDGGDAQEGENSKDGIRDFWLHALKRNKMTAKLIMEHDEPALRSLIDIRCVLHDDAKDGFTLLFFFDPTQNSAFENTCLTKRIDVTRSNGSVMVGKTTGTEIQWKPHQNLTVEEKSKKQRSKKTKQIRYVTVTEPRPSFFRYFQSNTAQNPFSDSQARMGDDDDDEEEEEEDEEFENSAETDHEVALEIKDKIIPKAVEFFTGEVQTDDDDDEDDDFEDEEEEEDEEEDEDEEEEDTYDQRRGGGNRSRQQGRGNRGAQQGGGKGVSKEQAECKQQ